MHSRNVMQLHVSTLKGNFTAPQSAVSKSVGKCFVSSEIQKKI